MVTSIDLPKTVCDDLRVLVRGLLDVCGDNAEKIILFGSFAKNLYQPDSDYDVCLVLKEQPDTNAGRQQLRNIGEECGLSRKVDVVICSRKELESGGMVFQYIRRDGVILYEQL